MATVVFLHGLNTYADGLVHMGPLTFGQMSDSWREVIEAKGWKFIDVAGLGFGAVEDQADKAVKYFDNEGILSADEPLHLIGHSMGGLVARVLAHRAELKGRIKTIITIGTPHLGAEITEQALSLAFTSPWLYRFMKFFGYDVLAKRAALENFTTRSLLAVHEKFGKIDGIRCVSFIGKAKYEQLCLPYQVIYSKLHPKGNEMESDGFISAKSQRWAEVGGEFTLDHMAEIGVYLNVSKKRRESARQEFKRLASAATEIIRDVHRNGP